jgi:hypothetical protein
MKIATVKPMPPAMLTTHKWDNRMPPGKEAPLARTASQDTPKMPNGFPTVSPRNTPENTQSASPAREICPIGMPALAKANSGIIPNATLRLNEC